MTVDIRPAEAGCESRLQQVERLSGERFRDVGLDHVADDEPMSAEELGGYISAGRAWVAVDRTEIVGYLLIEEVDGNAHVEQISVVPGYQGRGYGRLLLEAADDWGRARGARQLTLTTFADVPWNRPLYEHLGFRVMSEEEIGPELRVRRAHEAERGLDPDSRVCMCRPVARLAGG